MKIAVIGYSCSGKTTLTHELAKAYPEFKVFHTDEYQACGWVPSIYQIMDDVEREGGSAIVEGIHTYRLLRKGVQTGRLFFDLIINCKTNGDERTKRYTNHRDSSKLGKLPAFEKSLDKIFNDYLVLSAKVNRTPKIIDYNS